MAETETEKYEIKNNSIKYNNRLCIKTDDKDYS